MKFNKPTTEQIYDFVKENQVATFDELCLITNIDGFNEKTLNAVIFARTGYHDMEQCVECEPESFPFIPDGLITKG